MLSWIREKFGTVVIGGIIAFIAFVFVFYGVFSPKNTRGMGEGAVAGTVNGDPISIADFNREYRRRLEFYKQIAGGAITEDQIRGMRIKEGVFNELVRKKLLVQEAERQGMVASDEEVRDRIREIPSFQKDGKFDLTTYKQLLEANSQTPGSFERLVREDISMQQWENYFRDRVHVSDEEAKREYLSDEDKRNIKYVMLTNEAGRKGVKVDPAEIQKFFSQPAMMNLAKAQFEGKKQTEFKGQTFDVVKDTIARELIAAQKSEEVRKINEQLADQVIGALRSDKASDAKVNALLKPYKVEVKSTGMVNSKSSFISGVGEAPELLRDAFAKNSAIQGKAKKYNVAGGVAVAMVVETQVPELAKFDTKRDAVIKQIAQRKVRELYDEWMQKLTKKAKVDKNDAVVSASSEG
ncbi:MAG: SurA N-terminal domain-containing protein [Bdellovibrionota bacterium]